MSLLFLLSECKGKTKYNCAILNNISFKLLVRTSLRRASSRFWQFIHWLAIHTRTEHNVSVMIINPKLCLLLTNSATRTSGVSKIISSSEYEVLWNTVIHDWSHVKHGPCYPHSSGFQSIPASKLPTHPPHPGSHLFLHTLRVPSAIPINSGGGLVPSWLWR